MAIFLRLGEVTFANTEIPPTINFGGAQNLAVKQLVGGQRIVDAMGRNDDDVTFSGLFFGSTAGPRARFLDNMRVAGQQLPLTYADYNYTVVIREFKANFERFYQIPYTITLTIVQDLNKPFPVLLPVAYDTAILNQLTEANDIASVLSTPSITQNMLNLTTLLGNIPSIQNATGDQIASVLGAITQTQLALAPLITSTSSRIFG